MNAETEVWTLLVYRLPTQPSSARVAVWRDLRRLGALPLQQSCLVVPERPELAERMGEIVRRIESLGGTPYLYRLTDLSADQAEELRSAWRPASPHPGAAPPKRDAPTDTGKRYLGHRQPHRPSDLTND